MPNKGLSPPVLDARTHARTSGKRRAAKTFSTARHEWVYRVACNKYQLFGTEGATNGFTKGIAIGTGKISSKGDLAEGNPCHVQGNDYEYPKMSTMPPPAQTNLLERIKRKSSGVLDGFKDIKKETFTEGSSKEEEEAQKEQLDKEKTSQLIPMSRGLIRVLADTSDEDEDVAESCKNCRKTEEENKELHKKLRRNRDEIFFV